MSLLGKVNLSVPSTPCSERGEHATLAAHVTEGSLSISACSRAGNSWDSGYGSTGTPGFGRVLLTSLSPHTMSLSAVLGHAGVHELNDIVSDGSSEDCGHGHVADDFALVVL